MSTVLCFRRLQEADILEVKGAEGMEQCQDERAASTTTAPVMAAWQNLPNSSCGFFSQHIISFSARDVRSHDRIASSTTTPPRVKEEPKVNLWRLSEFSVRILEIIRDCGSATNRDLCDKLGKTNNYVKQYLYNLRKYGLIHRDNENWKWYLNDLDNDFLLISIEYYILYITVKQK
ncbi:winged helix-turn-helix domain-containing protein [Candidatus Methanoperedens nitratireducens]|nr:winged helix-turn-helix domain-containing protein [Candidatus Methanoperedens nitroreducens]